VDIIADKDGVETVLADNKVVAENAGYIVYHDSKVVIFYSNDLDGTPSAPILNQDSEEAIKCVRGLAPLP